MAQFRTSMSSEGDVDPGSLEPSPTRPASWSAADEPRVEAVEPAAGVAVLLGATPKRSPVRASVADRLLSDEEADLVTAAGFLFPLTSVIASRVAFGGSLRVFTVAHTNATGRRVIIMPRTSKSAIIDISRL